MTTSSATLEYVAVPPAVLDRIRATGRDDFGNQADPTVQPAGVPLRCCLRLSREGERVVLVAYRPQELGGPYAEVGPVFVHAEPCGGHPDVDAFPVDFLGRRAVLRPYDVDGRMLDGLVAEPGQTERLVRDLLGDPLVDHVQVRNVVAGCWNFSVRRKVRARPPVSQSPQAKVTLTQ